MTRYSALILAFSFLAACSGDDDSGGGGTCMPGTSSACTCADGTMMGSSLCDANGVPGACLPCMGAAGTGGMGGAGGMGGMSGMGGAGGMGGMSGTGGAGGMSGMGGTGGTGGMMDDDGGMMDDDGGVEVDAAVDSGTDAGGNTAEEGEQNGSCGADDNQCDDGLGCYRPDMNLTGFCTLECGDDDDCDAIGGADYTCYTMTGLCRVQCDRANGNEGCPDGFECADVLGADRCVPMD